MDALCCLLFVHHLPRIRRVASESRKNSQLIVRVLFCFFSSSCGGKGEAEGKGRGRERERETAEVRAEKVLVAANFGKKGYESESYTI